MFVQIRSRDKHINNLKKKCQKESELKRENQQRIETLERYLADLPTMEDYQSQNKQVRAVASVPLTAAVVGLINLYINKHACVGHQLLEAEQQVAQLKEKTQELEVCLETTRLQLREKEAYLEEQKRKERELLTTVTE